MFKNKFFVKSSLATLIAGFVYADFSVTPSEGPYYYGDTSQLTVSGGDGTPIAYSVTAGSCTVSQSGLVSFPNATVNSPASASCAVNAVQASTNDSVSNTFNYSLMPNNLLISQSPSSLAYNESANISVIRGNGSNITWGVTGGCVLSSANNSGATVTANSASGSCVVTASQGLNNNIASTTVSSDSIALTRAVSTTPINVSLDNASLVSGDLVYNTQAQINYSVNGVSGLTYNVPTVSSGDCEIVTSFGVFSNTYYLKATSGSGTCTVNMTASSDNYTYSGSYTVNLLLASAPAIVLSPANASSLAYNQSMNLSVTGGNDSSYTYSSSNNCSLSNPVTTNGNGSVTVTSLSGSGICTVVVSQNATSKYNSVNSNYVISLTPATSGASLSSTSSSLIYGDSATVTLTSNNTSAVTFSTTPGCQAVSNGNSAAITVANASLGSCTVTATQAASGNYSPVTVSTTIALSQATPSVVVSGVPSSVAYHTTGSFTLSSFSQARYTISGNANCSTQLGSTTFNNQSNKYDTIVNVYGTNVGSCNITYSQASDGVNYSSFANASLANINIIAAQLTPSLTASMGESTVSYGNNVTLDFSGGNSSRVTYAATAGCNLSTTSANTTGGSSSVIVSVANASLGSCTVTASQVADSNYAATSSQFTLSLSKANPSIAATSIPVNIAYLASANVSFTSNSTEGSLNIVGSNGCTVSNVNNSSAGVVTATVTSNASSGNCSLAISQLASNNYNAANISNTSISLVKADPVSSFTLTSGSSPLSYNTQATLSLVTTSRGIVNFINNNPNNCSIVSTSAQSQNGNNYTTSIVVKSLVGTPVSGSGCDISANIGGDSNYNSATSNLVVPIGKANASITSTIWSVGADPVSSLAYNQVATVTITTPSSGAMAISSNALCSVSNISTPQASGANYVVTARVTALASNGVCNLSVSQLADANYSQYTNSASMPLTTAVPNLVITSPGTTVQYQQAGLNITSTSLSQGAVSYSIISGQSNCAINNGILIVSGASGSSCTLQASQSAAGNYSSQTVTEVINIVRSSNPPAIDLSDATKSSLSAIQYNQTVVLNSVNTTNGSTLTYSLSPDTNPNVCILLTSGSVTSLKASSGTGSCSVRVSESATAYYNSATSSYYSFSVNKAPQESLSFGLPGGVSSVAYNQTIPLTSQGGSGTGSVSYSVTSGSQYCSIVNENGILKLKGLAGTNNQALCYVMATRAADANYSAVNSAVSSFKVTPINETSPLVITLQYNNLNVGNSSGFNVTGGSGSGDISISTSNNCHFEVNNDHLNSNYVYTVKATAPGNCVITAVRGADSNYNSESASVDLPVSRSGLSNKNFKFHITGVRVITN